MLYAWFVSPPWILWTVLVCVSQAILVRGSRQHCHCQRQHFTCHKRLLKHCLLPFGSMAPPHIQPIAALPQAKGKDATSSRTRLYRKNSADSGIAVRSPCSPARDASSPMHSAMCDASRAMQSPSPPTRGASPPMQGGSRARHGTKPVMRWASPAMRDASPPVRNFSDPVHGASPATRDARCATRDASPPVRYFSDPVHGAAGPPTRSLSFPLHSPTVPVRGAGALRPSSTADADAGRPAQPCPPSQPRLRHLRPCSPARVTACEPGPAHASDPVSLQLPQLSSSRRSPASVPKASFYSPTAPQPPHTHSHGSQPAAGVASCPGALWGWGGTPPEGSAVCPSPFESVDGMGPFDGGSCPTTPTTTPDDQAFPSGPLAPASSAQAPASVPPGALAPAPDSLSSIPSPAPAHCGPLINDNLPCSPFRNPLGRPPRRRAGPPSPSCQHGPSTPSSGSHSPGSCHSPQLPRRPRHSQTRQRWLDIWLHMWLQAGGGFGRFFGGAGQEVPVTPGHTPKNSMK